MERATCTLSAERRVVMYKFKECNQCPHEFNDKNLEPCKDCVPKKKTNADRIRAMSDEELAEFINFGSPDCSRHCADFKPGCSFSCNHNHGNDVILKWLQSEAEMEK